MPRRKVARRREAAPDPIYQSRLVSKFVNGMMRDGKKSTALSHFYSAMEELSKKGPAAPLQVFRQAIENVKPVIETRSRRVGGANYQVPIEVRPERKTALAIRWIIEFARSKKGKAFSKSLAEELLEASNNQGGAIKRKEDTHKMAEANKAFAHYKW
ncbi:MAG: 30S ribosomal protein S7 [Candidatus Hydrogenedentes bacterium CG07_land_8_20_14_0_80_42_17]|nr:MAG: 30S ribosomal protein S7 [Candidatus Hydrogenedentes bacterium CG1_02_42_14]PIU47972.1 MAG: 30S ribosomal protein S7 [Candidatus Hydrogenedentes bacterium CG07_land_8_20_14_0_80_42_17]